MTTPSRPQDDGRAGRAPWETDPDAWKRGNSTPSPVTFPIVAPDDTAAVSILIRDWSPMRQSPELVEKALAVVTLIEALDAPPSSEAIHELDSALDEFWLVLKPFWGPTGSARSTEPKPDDMAHE